DTGQRNYDLRKLIDDIWLIVGCPQTCLIGMRLRCDSSGSGRPEQVMAALGLQGHPLSVHRTRLTEAVCGPSYTFGRDRTGDAGMLLHVGRGRGVAVHIVQPVKIEGTIVSSSVIRRLLREGGVRDAARLLGRWYGIQGAVVQGEGRGRSLGFPTANLMLPGQKITPAAGIYAAFSRTPAGVHRAAVSIGTRPTFGPGRLVIEAHLLDVSEDLYGAEIELYFVDRLRDEMTFASVDELVRQMHDDISQTRRLLQRHAMPFTPIEA
ncbi:MAG: hypothetical protein HYU43_04320, partial [Armatimonadetes bacterium]|nr:hypothetical protein [Armatimonadota bacterium]